MQRHSSSKSERIYRLDKFIVPRHEREEFISGSVPRPGAYSLGFVQPQGAWRRGDGTACSER